ncbi:YmfQ family protein [Domibacillus indicus]|uniref:putative phage tail protein n=1 Tax=Domibacillus indicus TaxID=1437523 RepID=UPI00203E0825|nr:putative phage tail protein [Domibacillus indicus]MCM3789415.1 YmfQ family protein [Domibacillus indicus]
MTLEERVEAVMQLVPSYYDTSQVYRDVLTAILSEHQRNAERALDLRAQLHVQTATWGLKYWEFNYNLSTIETDSYELRRARVMAKRAGLSTFTKPEALRLANMYSVPQTARFRSIPRTYRFMTMHNIDHLVSFDGMIEAFEEMKPAHMRHVVGLYTDEELIIEDTVSVNLNTYHTVNEFRVGMTPIKSQERMVL